MLYHSHEPDMDRRTPPGQTERGFATNRPLLHQPNDRLVMADRVAEQQQPKGGHDERRKSAKRDHPYFQEPDGEGSSLV